MISKNQLFLLLVIALGLMAFMPKNLSVNTKTQTYEPDYLDIYYQVGPRFQAITKNELTTVKTVADFFGTNNVQPLLNYTSVEIVAIENDIQVDKGLTNSFFQLSKDQVDWLRNLDYAHNFLVRAYFSAIDPETGEIEQISAEPHFTVVPEKQAAYSLGEKALIDYIATANFKNTVGLNQDDLTLANLSFNVSIDGTLSNFALDHSTGSIKIDKAIVEILKSAPGTWIPAQNAHGENVAQQLTLTLGGHGC